MAFGVFSSFSEQAKLVARRWRDMEAADVKTDARLVEAEPFSRQRKPLCQQIRIGAGAAHAPAKGGIVPFSARASRIKFMT